MGLWTCRKCTTRFAVGLPFCPHCTGTDIERDEDGMAKITKHDGPSNVDELAPGAPAATSDGTPTSPPDTEEGYEVRTIAELRQLLRDRNAERDQDHQLRLGGDKEELVRRLQDDDREQAKAQAEADGQGERV